jgi:hypothetical protein
MTCLVIFDGSAGYSDHCGAGRVESIAVQFRQKLQFNL